MTVHMFSLNQNFSWELLKKYLCYVSKERQEKTKKYVSDNSKAISLITELLLRFSLVTEFGIDNKEIKLSYNKNGKPILFDMKKCYFSISHSNDKICVLTSSFPVGVDIEFCQNVSFEKIAKRFFSENEYEKILSDINPIRMFFEIWTKKEAYIKLFGLSLLKSIKSSSVEKKKIFFYSAKFEHYALSIASLNTIPKIEIRQISLNKILEKLVMLSIA